MNDIKFEWFLTSPGHEFRARCEATLDGRCFELTVDQDFYDKGLQATEAILEWMLSQSQ